MATSRIDFAAGEVIFREGDPPTTAFLVESGEILISTHQGDTHVVLGQLGPGDLLGEMAVIDASPRTATAKALTACALIAVGREQIHERLEEADPIVRALVRGQLARYRSALATFRGEDTPHHNGDAGDGSVFEPGAADKIRLETQLKDALNRRALEVRYQPIYEIAAGRVRGYEALIRWEHPTRGAVSPAEFIALAEETSLIVPVGRYVFEEVCSALEQLHVRGISPLPFVAVNVSGRQLEGAASILDELRVIANLRGVPVDAIKIEITESLTLDVDRVSELIEKCHAADVKVALDDFGTGYSNLGHLHKLQFDTVKLDQGFVRQMLHAPRCYAIVNAIVDLVNALDADMVAEGVETDAQLDALREMGCRYAQGYLIGRPVDRAAMIAAQLKG
jgi:EAL domain-containing protein (putative c-di-GMP-specific phosphodiesterase class I)